MAELCVIRAVVTLVVIFGTYMARGKAECIVNIRSDLGYMSPLAMRTASSAAVLGGTGFLLPSTSAPIASLHNGEEVALLCAGSDNRLNILGTVRQYNEAVVQCDTGFSFEHSGQYVPISDFQCTAVPQSTIRADGTCSSGQKRLQIGYEMSSDRFIRLIDICFDDINYSTYYVNYTLVNGIQRRQVFEYGSNVDRVDYYNSLPDSPDAYYTCSNQRTAVGALGSSRVNQYIKCSDNINYVVKAHLAAVSDFVYFAQQESTKQHINVVPMWYSIKNGNWLNLEEEIRQYASNASRGASDLVIYSGTFGVTNLDNHRMYLGRDHNDMNVVPVPQWVWKLVYEPSTKEGIVFLVVNNPYRLSFACRCVCAQTQWTLAWNRGDAYKGYVYCCTVNNFRSVFSGLPNFEVTGLLTKNRPYRPLLPDIPAQ